VRPGDSLSIVEVHPHGRGEKALPRPWVAAGRGSPPRAWGKERVIMRVEGIVRFTPTGVGKSRHGPTARAREMVHPHGRGEKLEAS